MVFGPVIWCHVFAVFLPWFLRLSQKSAVFFAIFCRDFLLSVVLTTNYPECFITANMWYQTNDYAPHQNEIDKEAVLSQRWPRNAPYTWVPWNFSGLPDYAHGYYSQHFHGLLFGSTLGMFLQNLKSVALSVPQIIGGTPKIWTVPGYALAPFSRKFLIGFYSDWPYKCTCQICSP